MSPGRRYVVCKNTNGPTGQAQANKNAYCPKLRFIRQEENRQIPEAKSGDDGACLMVSKFKTDINLPTETNFDGTQFQNPRPDVDTFRIEVTDYQKGVPEADRPKITLKEYEHFRTPGGGMGRRLEGTLGPYATVEGSGENQGTYRTKKYIRLVSDNADDRYPDPVRDDQSIRTELGREIEASLMYQGEEYKVSLFVGRPASEQGVNALQTIKCHVVLTGLTGDDGIDQSPNIAASTVFCVFAVFRLKTLQSIGCATNSHGAQNR